MNFCSMNILRDGMQCNLIDIGSSGEATKVSFAFILWATRHILS